MTANDVCGECDGPLDAKYLDDWGNRVSASWWMAIPSTTLTPPPPEPPLQTSQLISNISSTLDNVYINLVSTLSK